MLERIFYMNKTTFEPLKDGILLIYSIILTKKAGAAFFLKVYDKLTPADVVFNC